MTNDPSKADRIARVADMIISFAPLDLISMYDLVDVVWPDLEDNDLDDALEIAESVYRARKNWKLAERLKIERLNYLGYVSSAQLDDYTDEEIIAMWQRHLAKREPRA